ncbi:MAG: methyltransferase domain-containing protein [Phycisphaerales bacterium]|nr:methyltransferase domain-containing protein [Phycisphaerales bacterium]
MTREELLSEIAARKPWYQRIEFPEYGVTTTDDIENAYPDRAPDNQVEGLSPEQAAQQRPVPKWKHIEGVLPDVQGLDVLEVGSNCGFFSFKFAQLGAKRVVGLDVVPKWLDHARWCNEILGHSQVSFHNCDFMNFTGDPSEAHDGLLRHTDSHIPLPDDTFDLIFMSTVLDHTFFPFLVIYKMLRMSRRWVVIDGPVINTTKDEAIMKQGYALDGNRHGSVFTPYMFAMTFFRHGIPKEDVHAHAYNNGENMTFVVDTTNMRKGLIGA